MIPFLNYREEGEPVMQGLNLFSSKSRSSKGFVVRVGPFGFRWRYSKLTGRHHIGFRSYTDETEPEASGYARWLEDHE